MFVDWVLRHSHIFTEREDLRYPFVNDHFKWKKENTLSEDLFIY
jgi:hypothetical protein